MKRVYFALALAAPPCWADDAGFLPYRNTAAVSQGRALYAENCASCHGTELEGQENWRERDTAGYLPAPPHDPSGHTWHHPDEQLFAITKHGIAKLVGNGYQSQMAGYGETLTDEEIIAVLAFIKSTWPARIIQIHNDINRDAGG